MARENNEFSENDENRFQELANGVYEAVKRELHGKRKYGYRTTDLFHDFLIDRVNIDDLKLLGPERLIGELARRVLRHANNVYRREKALKRGGAEEIGTLNGSEFDSSVFLPDAKLIIDELLTQIRSELKTDLQRGLFDLYEFEISETGSVNFFAVGTDVCEKLGCSLSAFYKSRSQIKAAILNKFREYSE